MVNKTASRGLGQPGLLAELKRDLHIFLDHQDKTFNVECIRERIAALPMQTNEAQMAKNYDIDRRLTEVDDRRDAQRVEFAVQKTAIEAARHLEPIQSTSGDMAMELSDNMP